ncbi:MAG: type II secretion system F family protein [Fimbriimonadaceae bacterium]|nr:type II secretion system F family protein [Alphaproteobacteria bacterium]
MIDLLESVLEPQVALTILVAVAVFASILTFAMPLLQGNRLDDRIKSMSKERAVIRTQERAKLYDEGRSKLRQTTSKGYMTRVVDNLNLKSLLNADSARERLKMAGYRSPAAVITFLFFRVVLPPAAFILSLGYLWFINDFGKPPMIRLLISLGIAFAGFYLPNMLVTNTIQKRQKSLIRAFPDALDLLLICVESGMSIEASFRKVSEEIGSQSIELAEEMMLTTAELSYLSERRSAYENLAKRTGLDGVKAVSTSLIQAEKYGTAIGQALRVMAQENRDIRMATAEKKAAALPPKLTVPMILFFLPVLFVVILGPAVIQVMGLD